MLTTLFIGTIWQGCRSIIVFGWSDHAYICMHDMPICIHYVPWGHCDYKMSSCSLILSVLKITLAAHKSIYIYCPHHLCLICPVIRTLVTYVCTYEFNFIDQIVYWNVILSVAGQTMPTYVYMTRLYVHIVCPEAIVTTRCHPVA